MNIRRLILPLVDSMSSIISMCCRQKGKVFILTFHSIRSDIIKDFESLIQMLSEEVGFITPSQFTRFLSNEYDLDQTRLLLTFDDGFYSNHLVAERILNRLKIKAIFFIPTAFIDCSNKSELEYFVRNNLHCPVDHWETRSMDRSQILELFQEGHLIGSHTVNHPNLGSLIAKEELEREILDSKSVLEEYLCTEIMHFAYPFGNINSINRWALDYLRKYYKYIYSGIRGPNIAGMNLLTIRREAISLKDDIIYNKMISKGALSFYYYFDRRKLNSMVY
jgi:peptidoglycan/xylan/chitin deacetylase (PgdA/CDA1 family)